jgi:hypothetical protein
MDWLKKNLVVVISGVVSLVIIGGAGWYLFSKIQADQSIDEQYNDVRSKLSDFEGKKPFPNLENVDAAKEQLEKVNSYLTNASRFFGQPIVTKNWDNTEFLTYLTKTVTDLRNAAQTSKTTIPTNYWFSFAAQNERAQFDSNTMTKVVAQVEDVQMLASACFNAHIYELIAIQRAPVTLDDTNAMTAHASDYLATKRVSTTDFTTIYPYAVTIRCSSTELGAILEGLARAQYGFFVKWVRVEPGEVQAEGGEESAVASGPSYGGGGGMSAAMRRRYGLMPRGGEAAAAQSPEAAQAAQAAAKKIGVVLKEKPLKVMLMIEVIRGLAPTRNP